MLRDIKATNGAERRHRQISLCSKFIVLHRHCGFFLFVLFYKIEDLLQL